MTGGAAAKAVSLDPRAAAYDALQLLATKAWCNAYI